MAKKRLPLYGIIGILEIFWPITWPNIKIFNLFSTINLHILCFSAQYLFKCGYYGQKPPKCTKSAISQCATFTQLK